MEKEVSVSGHFFAIILAHRFKINIYQNIKDK